jgi:hypothetical protein
VFRRQPKIGTTASIRVFNVSSLLVLSWVAAVRQFGSGRR